MEKELNYTTINMFIQENLNMAKEKVMENFIDQ